VASSLGNFAPDVSYLPLWNSWPAWTVLMVMSEERETNQKQIHELSLNTVVDLSRRVWVIVCYIAIAS